MYDIFSYIRYFHWQSVLDVLLVAYLFYQCALWVRGSRALLAERVAQRRGHFMPPALLESQLSILEEPSPDERAWVCDISQAPDAIVADLVKRSV